MHIAIKIIQFPGENPLPYVPAHCAWADHVKACPQCQHADQMVQQIMNDRDMPGAMIQLDPEESQEIFGSLCGDGTALQTVLSEEIMYQRQTSQLN